MIPSSILAILLLAQEAPTPLPYAVTLQEQLAAAAKAFASAHSSDLRAMRGHHVTTLELEIGPAGEVFSERMALSSRSNQADDLARGFVFDIEPFATPDATLFEKQNHLRCLVRLVLAWEKRRPRVTPAVACQAGGGPLFEVAGLPGKGARDASAKLFEGWAAEGRGDHDSARKRYKEAIATAPGWDLAARAAGLALVRVKKVPQAIPYLDIYVESRRGAEDAFAFAREIERYKKIQEERIAKQNRVRERLSKSDIALGIRKGYPLLEPCLKRARRAGAIAVGVETLQLTWRIKKDGGTERTHLDGPQALLMTEHADCIERAMSAWRFPRYSAGSDITASRVPIKVRGAPPPRPKNKEAPQEEEPPEPVADEPTFSQCERTPDEIQGYIRRRFSRVRACIMAERRRAPRVPMPEDLPILFVIDANGPVRNVLVDHRAYREGALAACVSHALGGSLLPTAGADCPAETSLDLRHLAPKRR